MQCIKDKTKNVIKNHKIVLSELSSFTQYANVINVVLSAAHLFVHKYIQFQYPMYSIDNIAHINICFTISAKHAYEFH